MEGNHEGELTTVSKPFPSTHPHPTSLTESKFPSALFLNFAQAIASCLSAISYLGVQSWQNGSLGREGWRRVLGINQLMGSPELKLVNEKTGLNGTTHGHAATASVEPTKKTDTKTTTTLREKLPFLLLQVSIFQTLAGPIGFSALRHISYPTMVLGKVSYFLPHLPLSLRSGSVLIFHTRVRGQVRRKDFNCLLQGRRGTRTEIRLQDRVLSDDREVEETITKNGLIVQGSGGVILKTNHTFDLIDYVSERANIQSCKLIPVLLLNVILYRRRFSPHKYLVVSLVTVGISMFMFFGPAKKKGGEDSAWGLGLLMIKYVYSSFDFPQLCPTSDPPPP